MAIKITNLTVQQQNGVDNTFFATWKFDTTQVIKTSSGIKEGDVVKIKPDKRKWYNGTIISTWVYDQEWYVDQVKGDTVVLGKNVLGGYNIQSKCKITDVTKVDGGTGEGSTVDTTFDNFEVTWSYSTPGYTTKFNGKTENVTEKVSVYNPPSNADIIYVAVKPVAKKTTRNDVETEPWKGTKSTATFYLSEIGKPDKPSTPTVNINGFRLTASIENITDSKTDTIDFQLYNEEKVVVKSRLAEVKACRASTYFDITSNHKYRVRCRSANGNKYSDYSDFSNAEYTIPYAPDDVVATATSDTSIHVKWAKPVNATSYEVEYTTDIKYFDTGSDQVKKVSNITTNNCYIEGLESGKTYVIRVRALNDKNTTSSPYYWTNKYFVTIGKRPSAPTTWSSSTTVVTGEPLTLYWVHNTVDGSSQLYAELYLEINGVAQNSITIKNSTDEEEKDKTSSYVVDTSQYPQGSEIKWKVRTKGVINEFSDWSVDRVINIYAKPYLSMSVIDSSGNGLHEIESFPFYVSAIAGPNTQEPIGYHLEIISVNAYETFDELGNSKYVNAGESIYSKFFDTSDPLMVMFTPGNINLDNDKQYCVVCTVSMNSGLSTNSMIPIVASWTDSIYEPNASLGMNYDSYSMNIRPYCVDEEGEFIENVLLDVYRRDYDGSFIKINDGSIDNTMNTTVVDPHPQLDIARYRIVATDTITGAVSFTDLPGYPVGGKSVIIQWAETWQNFDVISEDELEQPTWSGSMLMLPYDIDVSDSYQADVELVAYAGRARPVAYYGTQLGESSTWSVSVPKGDKNTIYALRRLAIWTDNVYVREPSGSGYWAHVSVSFNQKHNDLKVPVTLNLTRVEGGV